MPEVLNRFLLRLTRCVLLCYRCRQQVEKKTVLENLDLVLLAMDEIVDGGCVCGRFPVAPRECGYR